MIYLIDADTPAFQAARRTEQRIEFPEESWVQIGFRRDALLGAWKSQIAGWLEDAQFALRDASEDPDLDAVEYIFTCPPDDNFRTALYPPYKSNRKTPKPAGYYWLRDKLRETDEEVVWPKLEADDVCGILQTINMKEDRDSIIISIDKDLLTIPGWNYNPDKDRLTWVTPKMAAEAHMRQTVCGDKTDGYPGLPGVADKTLDKWLKKNEEELTWKAIETLWREQLVKLQESGCTELSDLPDLLTQARMARILQETEWNFLEEEVILWELPD